MFSITPDNSIQIEPYYLTIPEFNNIWNKDKSANKQNAMNIFKYIFFISDFKSPYKSSSISKEDLVNKVKKDFMTDDFKEDKLITDAINKYTELQYTKTLQLFDSLDKILSQITEYYAKLDLTTIADSVIDAKISKALENAEKIPKVITQIESVRIKVEKDLNMKEESIRGKGTIQKREVPKNKRK